MRIAYLAYEWFDPHAGPLSKMAAQMAAWKDAGHDVCLFLLSGSPSPQDFEQFEGLPVNAVFGANKWSLLSKGRETEAQINDWRPDLVYARFTRFFPAMWRIFRTHPAIGEVNSHIANEYARHPAKLYSLYNRIVHRPLMRRLSGAVFVTEELCDTYASLGKPSLVCGNGVRLADFECLPPASNTRPRLVFVGAANQSHAGVDKIPELARRFDTWHFDLIGCRGESFAEPLPPNLEAHPSMSSEEYLPILANADIAIGSLALHRNGMSESSSLKVRESLARGLPTIIANRDTDFPRPVPFLLQVPNREDNLQTAAPEIARFVEAWRGRRVDRANIAHLNVNVKEKVRLEFFERILSQAAGR